MKKRLPWLAALALIPAAQAVEYRELQPAASSLGFQYRQMGVTMDGKFRKFSAQLSFDPDKPAAARARIDVELASIDTGSAEADQEVGSKPWFHTAAYPQASFVASSIKPLGGNRYEASGKLSIKGRSQDIVAPLTYTPQGKQASFSGSFSFRRSDFAIGEGSWAAPDIVANEIRIQFNLVASGGK
ncbi:MAG: hypothetical protein RIR00_2115 [Pseudomonadota bacterium]